MALGLGWAHKPTFVGNAKRSLHGQKLEMTEMCPVNEEAARRRPLKRRAHVIVATQLSMLTLTCDWHILIALRSGF